MAESSEILGFLTRERTSREQKTVVFTIGQSDCTFTSIYYVYLHTEYQMRLIFEPNSVMLAIFDIFDII